MEKLFGENRKTINSEVMDEVKNVVTRRVTQLREVNAPLTDGKTRPKIIAHSYQVAQCGRTFASTVEYNAHFKFVHGVESGAKE